MVRNMAGMFSALRGRRSRRNAEGFRPPSRPRVLASDPARRISPNNQEETRGRKEKIVTEFHPPPKRVRTTNDHPSDIFRPSWTVSSKDSAFTDPRIARHLDYGMVLPQNVRFLDERDHATAASSFLSYHVQVMPCSAVQCVLITQYLS
jgi:hypothetical protein